MLFINTINDEEVLNSYNFARKADVVYSEIISKKNFEKINKENLQILFEDEDKIFYFTKNFEIADNQIIFTNNYLLDSLFELLRQNSNLKNLKLITHQTDFSITKKVFNSRPNSISKWYSINVDYKHPDLISIPIGLSNDYSPKNIFKYDYKNLNIVELENKIDKLYANFQKNTNFFYRSLLEKKLKKLNFITFDQPNLNSSEYLEKVAFHKYILCPKGNGLDTHRIWESLYAGSIPVTEKLLTNEMCSDLPVLRIDNFKKINKSILNLNELKLEDKDFFNEKLSTSFWIKKMREAETENNKDNSKKYLFTNSYNQIEKIISDYKKKLIYENRVKQFSTILRKLFQKILDIIYS